MPITLLLGLIGLSATFNQRLLDPLTPLVAGGLGVHVDLVVLLAPAYTLPFALCQPILGPFGDAWGKALMLKIFLVVLAVASVAGALAPTYEFLFASRMLAGLAAGGIMPAAIAIIADRFAVEQRQVAMSRFMTVMMMGQIISAPVSVIVAEATSWNAVMAFAGAMALAGYALAMLRIPPRPDAVRSPLSLSRALETYRTILGDARARICYLTVASEGLFIFGVAPHVALYLQHYGLGGVREAGFVLAAQGVGGLAFAASVSAMARRFTRHQSMRIGGVAAMLGLATMALAPEWKVVALGNFMLGFGFFTLHSGLQTEITEVMPSARSSAVSLHAFFMFLGMAAGPLVFGLIEDAASARVALGVSGALILAFALYAATALAKRASMGAASSTR